MKPLMLVWIVTMLPGCIVRTRHPHHHPHRHHHPRHLAPELQVSAVDQGEPAEVVPR